MTVEWRDGDVRVKLFGLLTQRMKLATVYLQGEVRKSINVGNRDGHNPSAPGEPPHKVTGRLQQSIVTAVVSSGDEIMGVIGTNLDYARRLELGFVGTDSRGHNIHQAPHPFLRRALADHGQQALEVLKTGRSPAG